MKPYVLNYSENLDRIASPTERHAALDRLLSGQEVGDGTLMTAVVEPGDPDEILAFSTQVTRSLEDCEDQDSILLGSTYVAETVEPSDRDEIFIDGSTYITKTLEPSDADELLGSPFDDTE